MSHKNAHKSGFPPAAIPHKRPGRKAREERQKRAKERAARKGGIIAVRLAVLIAIGACWRSQNS